MRSVGPLLLLAALPCAAQSAPGGIPPQPLWVDSAITAIIAWTNLAQGANPDAWSTASPRFRARIAGSLWHEWSDKQVAQWDGVGAARVTSVDVAHDDTLDPPADWVGVILVHNRARGGQLLQRVWAVSEGGGPWGVVDYALWPDGAAIVTNAYVRPIPWVPESYADEYVFGFHSMRRLHGATSGSGTRNIARSGARWP